MGFEPVKSDTGNILTLREWHGVDLFLDATALPPDVLSRSENIDLQRGPAARRAGAVKVARLAVQGTNGASRLFTDTAYGKVAANSALLIPKGGFFVMTHFIAVRGAGTTFINSNRQPSQTYGVVWFTLSSAGVFKANVRWASGSTTILTTAALTNSSTQHALLVYDDVLGTLTLYLNGVVAATDTPGAGLQPAQTAAIDWYFGVEWNPSAGPAAVTAGSAFLGDIDGFALGTLRGLRPSSGSTTFVEKLRRWSVDVWPTPQADFILAHYDFDEASGTTIYDRSRRKNHGTYVGAPAVSTPVAQLSAPVHHIGRIVRPDGTFNLVGCWGSLLYQTIGGVA
jgi:hypothetical protein